MLLYSKLALSYGASIQTGVQVTGWKRAGPGFEVHTSAGNYTGNKLVFAAGPWTSRLIPALSSSLSVTSQSLAWVTPHNPAAFELGRLPCWVIAEEDQPGIFYGFPCLPAGRFDGPPGLKLGHHFHGPATDPDNPDRKPPIGEEAKLIQVLNKYFPGSYQGTHTLKTCLYTNTPDEHFIIDFLPGYGRDVAVAAGFSGHGFKFVSVVGEIISDLITREHTELPVEFLNAARFLK